MRHSTGPGEVPTPEALGRAWARRSRQVLGAVLIVLAFVPIYRLMDTSGDAPHRRVSVEVAEVTLQLAWWGTIVTLLLALLFAWILPCGAVRKMGRVFVTWLSKPSAAIYALILSGLSFGLSVLTGRFLYQGFFTNVDEIASTLHARYLANGLLAGPIADTPEAWLIPNTLMVAEGWVSHFPPAHLLFMAALIRVGVPMLLGPISAGVLAGLVALSLPRLLPGNPGPARVAALLVAVAPFVVLLGGGSMSHVSAGAFGAAVLYAALRARDGHAWWGVAAGAAVGLMVSDRPLIGLVMGTVFTLGLWGPVAFGENPHRRTWFLRRAGATLLGGAPFAVFLGWFNQRLYGNPFTLGYVAAFGDRHRLGFHMDPWGYPYSIREAVAYTSSDMLSLGIQLLETPFPITAVIGLYLLSGLPTPQGGWGSRGLGRPPSGGERILLVPRCADALRGGPGMDHPGGDFGPGVGWRFRRHRRWTCGRHSSRPGQRSAGSSSPRGRTRPGLEGMGGRHDHVGHPLRRGRRSGMGRPDPLGQLPVE